MTMQSIGMALVHSLWEGGIMAALLALAFSLTRKSAPSVRYAIGMAGLVAMIVVPIATTVRTNSVLISPSVSAFVPQHAAKVAPSTSATTSPEIAASGAPSRAPVAESTPVASAQSIMSKLAPSLPWLVTLWLVGLIFLSARMIYGVAATRRIVRESHTASAKLADTVSRISETLGIERAVRALEGTRVTVPMVVGWIRPLLIAPSSLVTGLTPAQLDMLVAHELAHIRRYDYIANMAQTVIETLLFFHPAVWWLSERIREERENCCDDIALSVSGNDRKAYTATLLALEESRGDLTFASAASGSGDRGSLLRRAMRLLSGGPAHLDLGARWIAGVITIFAALFTTGPAVGKAADIPIAAKLDVIGMLTSAPDTVEREKYGSDQSRSAPGTIVTYNGTGSLTQRWQWAEDRADVLRLDRYWIGYLVAGDATSQMLYQDSDVPVRFGTSYIKGRMRFGDAENVTFTGASLRPFFGAHSPKSTAIFLQFQRTSGHDRLTRVHLGSYGIPAYFDRRPVIWIDSVSDRESIAQLRSLALAERSTEMRRDLISAIGMHRDVTAMLPPLTEFIDSPSEPDVIRQEAIESIGSISDPRAQSVLARIARHDPRTKTRKDAIEALQNQEVPAVTDTLISFASTMEDSRLRRAAIETLGERRDDRSAAFLKRVAASGSDLSSRREAVEALGSMNELGFTALADLALHGDAWVRAEAVEELPSSNMTKKVLDVLVEIVARDPSETVRNKAAESLGELETPDARAALRSIALNGTSDRLRMQAMETYSQHVDTDSAISFLKGVIANDRSESMKIHALELLSDLDDSAGIAAVRELARSSDNSRVRARAQEILSDR